MSGMKQPSHGFFRRIGNSLIGSKRRQFKENYFTLKGCPDFSAAPSARQLHSDQFPQVLLNTIFISLGIIRESSTL